MKILFIDNDTRGHHSVYFSALIKGHEKDSVLVIPQKAESIGCKQHIYINDENKKRSLYTYVKWLRELKKIIRSENPDIIHYLYGDMLYRYFGFGVRLGSKKPIVVTLHELRTAKLQQFSTKCICRKISKAVVHSEYIRDEYNRIGIRNVEHIEYPCFNRIVFSKEESCKEYDLDVKVPTIVSLGTTEKYKGLDILIEALKRIKEEFQLLIAGRANYYTEEMIKEMSGGISEKVFLHLSFLSEEDFAKAICASDIIAIPYRKNFNGASGPLGEGVLRDKCIIGSDYGNLGHTIRNNHLGYTFIAEDPNSLAETLSKALTETFIPDEQYREYQDMLSVDTFISKYRKIYEIISNMA